MHPDPSKAKILTNIAIWGLEQDTTRLRLYDERIVMADISKVQKLTGFSALFLLVIDHWSISRAFCMSLILLSLEVGCALLATVPSTCTPLWNIQKRCAHLGLYVWNGSKWYITLSNIETCSTPFSMWVQVVSKYGDSTCLPTHTHTYIIIFIIIIYILYIFIYIYITTCKISHFQGWVPQPDIPLLLRMLLDYWRHETAFRYPEDLIKSLGDTL